MEAPSELVFGKWRGRDLDRGRGGEALGEAELRRGPRSLCPLFLNPCCLLLSLLSSAERGGLPTLSAGSRDAVPPCQPLPRAPQSWVSSLSCSPGGRRPRLGQTCMTRSPNPHPPDQETEP